MVLLGGDLLVLVLSLVLMLLLRYGLDDFSYRLDQHGFPFSIVFLIWLGVSYLNGLYRFQLRGEGDLFRSIFNVTAIGGSASIIMFYAFSGFFGLTPKLNLLIFSALFLVLDYSLRSLLWRLIAPKTLNVVVLGSSPLIDETLAYLRRGGTEFNIVTWIKDLDRDNLAELSKTILDTRLHVAAIQPHLKDDVATMRLVYSLMPLKIVLLGFYDFYEFIYKKVPIDELKEGWFIENIAYRNLLYDLPKRFLDLVLSLAAGIILLPVGLLIGPVIKATSKGPVIYRQRRVGKNGAEFVLYKFRTMVHNSRGPYWTEPRDERVTWVGKYLRFVHLDEIPQLFNVIRGDLSLVGPRPERYELAEKYKDLPYYDMRHVARPGLTGWAQVNYRPSASLEEAHEKLRYDIYYLKNRSHFLDLHILLKTVIYLFNKRH